MKTTIEKQPENMVKVEIEVPEGLKVKQNRTGYQIK